MTVQHCLNKELGHHKGHHTGHHSAFNPHYRDSSTENTFIYFTILKREAKGFYMRLSYRGHKGVYLSSCTISLRTNKRSVAVVNAEYLKDALLKQAGSFADFNAMRAYIRSFAKELLTTKQPDWFYKGQLMVAQEAQHLASSIEQHEFLKQYKQVLTLGQTQQYKSLLDMTNDCPSRPDRVPTSDIQSLVINVQTTNITQLIDTYINEKIANNEWSTKTLDNRKTSFKVTLIQAFMACGLHEKDINDFTRADLINVRDKLTEKLKTSTLNSRMSDITSLFSYAEMCQLLTGKSPAIKLNIKDKNKAVDKYIPEDELNRFIQYMHNDFHHNSTQEFAPYLKWVVSLAAITGARQAEILQLRKTDIKTIDNVIYISINADHEGNTLKNATSERCVPLVDGAYEFNLQQFMEDVVVTCQDDSDYIFRLTKTTRSITQLFSKVFKRYKEANKSFPETATFHSLRHSMSTLCLNKGMPEAFTGKLLGHAQSITYGRYGSSGVDMVTLHNELKNRVFC
ncbi:MAG: site-specific integrase [Plesiomonas sp.]|uniref:site-specific integrase n=1 Tax=Plesiomonas sp. TaxID=2486279 RepID=UPI003F2C814E